MIKHFHDMADTRVDRSMINFTQIISGCRNVEIGLFIFKVKHVANVSLIYSEWIFIRDTACPSIRYIRNDDQRSRLPKTKYNSDIFCRYLLL